MVDADIHIVLGQSNAGGNANPPGNEITKPAYLTSWALKEGEASLTPSDINFHRSGQSCPWFDFARTWYDLTGRETIWVNAYVGGSPLLKSVNGVTYWEPVDSGSTYETQAKPMIDQTIAAVSQSPRFNVVGKYCHWIQGEADGGAASTPANHQAALESLIDAVDADYGLTKFAIYGLGYLTNDTGNAGMAGIRDAQASAAASRAKAVLAFDKAHTGTTLITDGSGRWTSGFSYRDTKHWSAEASACAGIEGAYATV